MLYPPRISFKTDVEIKSYIYDNPICRTEKETQMYRSLLDSVGEGKGGMFQENSIETCILSRVKQITSPGWMHETGARTWCTGKTWRGRVEREVGGGIRMGNTYKPMAVSFQCMTKSTTIKKIFLKIKSFTDKQKLREFSSTKPALHQMLKRLI